MKPLDCIYGGANAVSGPLPSSSLSPFLPLLTFTVGETDRQSVPSVATGEKFSVWPSIALSLRVILSPYQMAMLVGIVSSIVMLFNYQM